MQRPLLFIVVLTVSLFALMLGFGAFMAPYRAGGCGGMMGPNMMAGPGMWGGCGAWMTHGYGSSATGETWAPGRRDLNLSADNVKNHLERWITWQGNPHLKVGDVKEKDADTIVADIVTKDNSLVQRFVINRRNGFFRPSED